ncbi:tyrosine-type recombinase/integrase [Flavobacterium oreochromis]|nr:tyrosine-type recombinase/integrase [Flavobacterium oreochromis]
MVFIAGSKTGHQRYVPINKTAKQILRNYLKLHIEYYLFKGVYKEQSNTHYLQKIVKKYAKEAGITKRVYPHLLRHSIATHLLQQGMQLEKIAQFLGHNSLDSTHRYTHFNQ